MRARDRSSGRLSTKVTRHGVLLRVHGVGVLVSGSTGIGKSTLALALISRGHALVADDAVDFRRHSRDRIEGCCDTLLLGYLAVRELGVLDIRALYGARAVRRRQRLDLVICLTKRQPLSARALLSGRRSHQPILGLRVPVLSLSADVGHNLAVRVEAACLDQRLRLAGVAADQVFATRQQKAIHKK